VEEDTGLHLFDRFYRGEAGSAAGSGLGLAIARELAERMDGSLELRSRGAPTTFTLSLPAEPPADPAA
jgi:signal transduction histidine kinase